ncbi:MAG: DMT family transporter [Nitratireductor sp.]
MVQMEGGLSILKTRTPWLHAMRGLLIVLSNLTYFTALAVISLADATALFFVAPLIPSFRYRYWVGPGRFRLGAVAVGFLGVVVMIEPGKNNARSRLPFCSCRFFPLLPMPSIRWSRANWAQQQGISIGSLCAGNVHCGSRSAFCRCWGWALRHCYNRRQHALSAKGTDLAARGTDIWLFIVLGLNSAIVGYCIAQAYRMADAATVAPFEYIGLPMAVFWGWLLWRELPGSPNHCRHGADCEQRIVRIHARTTQTATHCQRTHGQPAILTQIVNSRRMAAMRIVHCTNPNCFLCCMTGRANKGKHSCSSSNATVPQARLAGASEILRTMNASEWADIGAKPGGLDHIERDIK